MARPPPARSSSPRGSWGLLVAGLVALSAAAGEPKAERKASPKSFTKIHTFSELLARADLIVLGEVGEKGLFGSRLKVLEVLKEPPRELVRTWVDPERLKRAAELLEQEARRRDPAIQAGKKEKPAPAKRPDPPAGRSLPPIAVVPAGRLRLPAPGTQALFFLWERLTPSKTVPLRYRLGHPQCLYDLRHAAEVKVELGRRFAKGRREYLRDWDRHMAARLAREQAGDRIRALPAGEPRHGLRLRAVRARRSIRDDNTFDVAVSIENARGFDQAVYDGPMGGFGVRLRKKGAASDAVLVLRFKQARLTQGLDPAVLAIVDAADFARVPKEGALRRELHFDVQDHPAQRGLDGEYVGNVFYTTDKDGKGLNDLAAAPWTGTLISQDFSVTFQAPAAKPPRKNSRYR